MSSNAGQFLSIPSGLDEITRKEIVAWNPQAKGRMLLRKSMNCLSFYLPMGRRSGRWVDQGERPEGVIWGAAMALFVDRWAPATTPEAE